MFFHIGKKKNVGYRGGTNMGLAQAFLRATLITALEPLPKYGTLSFSQMIK